MRKLTCRTLPAVLAAAVLFAACGSDGDDAGRSDAGAPAGPSSDLTIAVTTSILGDIVSDLVGDLAEVATIIPSGANAHDFQASAREAGTLADADAIVINGGGFEEGLLSVVEGAETDGVPVLDALGLLDEPDQEDGDAHAGDAHFFTDPLAMAEVVDALAAALPEQVPDLDADALRLQGDALVAELEALHEELEAMLGEVPADRRVLITDHDVLASFADRYDFEIIATVIPSGSTSDGVSGGALAELAALLRRTGSPAVFVEQTASQDLADTLAAEVGEVVVVPLYAESLGPADSEASTYAAMMRLNAQRIADALGG
jgi:zinc/manganese transport system substrate-binding protein